MVDRLVYGNTPEQVALELLSILRSMGITEEEGYWVEVNITEGNGWKVNLKVRKEPDIPIPHPLHGIHAEDNTIVETELPVHEENNAVSAGGGISFRRVFFVDISNLLSTLQARGVLKEYRHPLFEETVWAASKRGAATVFAGMLSSQIGDNFPIVIGSKWFMNKESIVWEIEQEVEEIGQKKPASTGKNPVDSVLDKILLAPEKYEKDVGLDTSLLEEKATGIETDMDTLRMAIENTLPLRVESIGEREASVVHTATSTRFQIPIRKIGSTVLLPALLFHRIRYADVNVVDRSDGEWVAWEVVVENGKPYLVKKNRKQKEEE